MGRAKQLGSIKVPTISSRYVGFYPCFQASPDSLVSLLDRSGKLNHGVVGSSGAGASAWSNANCFTSNTNPDTGFYLTKEMAESWVFSPSRQDSLIFSAQVYTPNSISAETIFRTGTSASTGGWWLETGSTGFTGSTPGARLKFYDTSAGVVDSVGYVSLPSNTWTTLTCIIDGPGNQAYLFVNGVLAPVSTSTNPRQLTNVSTMTVQAAAVNPWICSSPSGSSEAKRVRGIHYVIVPESAGAISDPEAIAKRLHAAPFVALTADELP